MRRTGALLAGLAAALALATAARLPAAWESGNALNHVSGVWLALADDLARGTFYRPVHDPDGGYGGTRYFPLVFAIDAALVRAGAPLLAAGYATALAAGLALAAGVFLLLRALGRGRAAAAAFAPVALAGFAGQHALSAARGDLLPVALSALALAALARGPTRRGLGAAALALALAFAAKPTALTAAAAALAWLLLRGRRRAALALALLVSAGAAGVVAATELLSEGRFLASVGAAGGGASLGSAIRAPARLLEQLVLADRAGLVLALGAAAVAAAALPPLARSARAVPAPLLLPLLWLAAAGAGCLAVLALPGTGVNHLLELEVSAAVLLGAATGVEGAPGRLARAAAPLAAAAGLLLALALWRADLGSSRLGEVRAVIRALPPAGPVFSEDPLVPLLAGRTPYLLDPFIVRLAAARTPELALPLADALRRGAFPAVVLFQDLEQRAADGWYEDGNLGLPLVAEIRRGYRRAGGVGRYHLYLPRDAPPASVARAQGAR